jgi:hypothetical protein
MANMFLAGYFMSVTLDKLFDRKWGLAIAYGGLTILNLVLALSARGE